MQKISIDNFQHDLQQLINQEALELHAHVSENQEIKYFIPYMMNDAVECYFILENCRTTGTWLKDFSGSIQAELFTEQDRQALILHQGNDQVFTIWFDSVYKTLQCYCYHEIGHFWVNGQEQWRQLVYMVGTIYDKYEYLGEAICNEKEMQLLPFMEFAPFRTWSPIHESILEEYPETRDGTLLMEETATEAGDKFLLFLLKIYALFPNNFWTRILGNYLASPRGQAVYEVIYKKIVSASSEYPARDYGKLRNQQIQEERLHATQQLEELGFTGEYPHFSKGNVQIMAAEEHPFTILDWEDFHFKIQYMISINHGKPTGLNSGFFKNRGYIRKDLEQISEL